MTTYNRALRAILSLLAASILYLIVTSDIRGQVSVAAWSGFDIIAGDTLVVGNAVRNIQADYTGRPWLATSRGLYSQFSADSFSLASFGVASYHQESVNNIFAIASGTTDLYVGTAQGFVVLDSASSSDTTRYDTADGLPGQLVGTLQIEVDADTLWMGTIKGLTLFVVDSATINTSEIDSTAGKLIHAMAIDCTGGTWYGSDKGLERQYLSYWFSYDTSDGLSSVPVYALAVDTSGNLWIGNDAGVDVFDMDTTWTNYDDDSLGVGPQVRALAHDKVDNIMWIGTLSGLAAYETGLPYPASAFRSYTTSSTSDSLGSDIITAVRPDTAANKTWIGTGEGLYLLYESSKVP